MNEKGKSERQKTRRIEQERGDREGRKTKVIRGQKPNVSRGHENQSSRGLHTEAQKAHEEVF